ncbi:MAG TPA: GerMN domain-containing protein [Thermodesulfovibrionia bacterium]|nr:GerMN domain-containing protein [Thermodesulfovibrionia bacterium]
MRSKKGSIYTKRTKKSSRLWLYIISVLVILCTGALTIFFELKPYFLFTSSPKNTKSVPVSDIHESRALTVYYLEHGELRPEKTRPSSKLTRTGIAEDVASAYLKPYHAQLNRCFLSTTGVAYLDVSEDLRKGFKGSVMEEYLFVMGMLKSLKANISGIKAVMILIDGNEIESIAGHIELTYPIEDVDG